VLPDPEQCFRLVILVWLLIDLEDISKDVVNGSGEDLRNLVNLDLISAWAPASEEELKNWKPLTLDDEGFEELDREMCNLSPGLVILDPLFAFVGEKRDINAANHTRAIMSRLAILAEKHNSAIVGIRHLTKGSRGKSIYRGIGSIDLTAAARSVLLVGADPNNQEPDVTKSVLLHIKHNLSGQGQALDFEIREGLFYWTGNSQITAGEVLAPESSPDEASSIDEAVEFLKEMLSDGPVDSQVMERHRKQLNISISTLKRARKTLGVKATRKGEKLTCSM